MCVCVSPKLEIPPTSFYWVSLRCNLHGYSHSLTASDDHCVKGYCLAHKTCRFARKRAGWKSFRQLWAPRGLGGQ